MEKAVVFSVYEITRHLRQVIESSIDQLYVTGEVSNYVKHSSGHIYFNLKDDYATLRCTFFKNVNYRLDFTPRDGMQVICQGKLTLFEKGGTYNLNVQNIQEAGIGQAQRKFEELKQRLQAEGLFDSAHKRALPKFPERIGIVTSPTGAALQDIRNVITRRYPAEIMVYPALVQGSEAAKSLIRGIEYFNLEASVTVIILTRGGGSQEDLFCFNDEALARAIYNSRIPVVSAVGHEIDYTISDFVADLRAPTPSAAAEMVVPNREDLFSYLGALKQRLSLHTVNRLQTVRQNLTQLNLRLNERQPERVMQGYRQRFDYAAIALENFQVFLQKPRHRLELLNRELAGIRELKLSAGFISRRLALTNLEIALNQAVQTAISNRHHTLTRLSGVLHSVSPQRVMKRGWTMTTRNGKLVKNVTELQTGDHLQIHFHDGKADTQVMELHPEPHD